MVWGICSHAFHLQCINRCGEPCLPLHNPSILVMPAVEGMSLAGRLADWPPSPSRWLSTQLEQKCPFCRRQWEFKQAETAEDVSGA